MQNEKAGEGDIYKFCLAMWFFKNMIAHGSDSSPSPDVRLLPFKSWSAVKEKNLQKQRTTHAVIFDKIMGKVDQIHPLAFGSFLSYDIVSRK